HSTHSHPPRPPTAYVSHTFFVRRPRAARGDMRCSVRALVLLCCCADRRATALSARSSDLDQELSSLFDSGSADTNSSTLAARGATPAASWTSLGSGDCLTSSGVTPLRYYNGAAGGAMSDDECKAACEGFSWCEALSRNNHHVCGGKCCVLYVGYGGPDPGVISDWSQQFLGNPTNIGDTTAGFSLPVGCTRITRPASASAVGDPHLQNIYGQRFDLMKTGRHVLINVPKGNVENTLLRVDADAERLGGQCADIYPN
ncbi:unnamed protein product, partial [Prorocentrum cordatum]